MSDQISRRELGKVALGGALGAALGWPELGFASSAQEQTSSAAVRSQPISGIHLSQHGSTHPTDEDFLFFKQLGLDCVFVRGTTVQDQTVEGLRSIKKRYADAGIIVSDVDNNVYANLDDIVLGRPGRDKAIEACKAWIRALGEAGIAEMEPIMYDATGRADTGEAKTRGVYGTEFDLNSSDMGGSTHRMSNRGSANSLLFGREYSRDEIWANYTYFVKQIAPVAEEARVRISFDPDDPPVPSLFGVPRMFSNFEDCKKALEIANSPNVGMCLGCGPWLEGGAATGMDAPGFIRYFASQKQLFHVYCRNPSSALPRFHETFIDYGYYDIYKIVKTMVDVNYDGVLTLDHVMPMVGGLRTYQAFGMGYLRAMLQTAQRGYHD